jgi:cell shape-determining protein MreC
VAQWFAKYFIPMSAGQGFIELLKDYNTKFELLEPMNTELRKQLQAEFALEVDKLSELLGRDLTQWNNWHKE